MLSTEGNKIDDQSPGSHENRMEEQASSSCDHVHDKHILSFEDKSEAKVEVKRKQNTEEQQNCCFNVFFCFYFQFIFRCHPIRDEDIYEPHSKDKTELTTNNGKNYWMKRYVKYLKQMEEYNAEIIRSPSSKIKKPSKPSLIFTILFGVGTLQLIQAIILWTICYIMCCLQPYLMKLILEVITRKMTNPNEEFPYATAIILMVSNFFAILDSWGNRILYHYSANVRTCLNGMIFNKTLLLNITSQNNVDAGRLLSLLASDCSNVGDMIWMPFMLLLIPLQIIMPFAFVCAEIGWVGIISVIVVLLFFPIQGLITMFIGKHLNKYLAHNDERNRVTNETLQGIRVVKFSGMEDVFMRKICSSRNLQLKDMFNYTFFQQFLEGVVRVLPPLVNLATFGTYIGVYNLRQEEFTLKIMPTILFLTLLTRQANMIPTFLQGVAMIWISQKRIRDFLLLPELKKEPVAEPKESDIALVIENGTFKWGDPPDIPMSMEEEQKQMEANKREKQDQERELAKDIVGSGKMSATDAASSSASASSLSPEPSKAISDSTVGTDIVSAECEELEGSKQICSETNSSSSSSSISNNLTDMSSMTVDEVMQSSEDAPRDSSSISLLSLSSSNSCLQAPPAAESTSPQPSPSPSDSTPITPSFTSSSSKKFLLHSINLRVAKGSLTMVIGSVGSGKSSLGSALIGDMEKLEGAVQRAGNIAYCPQVAWINNNTVKGNILFGSALDEERYREAVRVCSLETDLRELAAGDQTAIGEKGVNLSGGQKARIQLARAVYADRDIYILDDPLSAVDAHVGRFLFDECIEGALRGSGKTVLLITNQLQFLDKADQVVVMKRGTICAQGKYEELKEQGIDFSRFVIKRKGDMKDRKMKEKSRKAEGAEGMETANKITEKNDKELIKIENDGDERRNKENGSNKEEESKAGRQIMTEEEYETEKVPVRSYISYVRSLFPWWGVCAYFILALIANGGECFQSYWLGVIGSSTKIEELSYGWKIGVYGLLTAFVFICQMLRGVMGSFGVWRSMKIVHDGLLRRVMHCPSSFFDTTPLGRVLNRLTGDMTQVDQVLFGQIVRVVNMASGVVGQVVIVAVDTPIFLAIGLPVLVVYCSFVLLYSRAVRNLQRLEAIARSPVLSLFGEVVNGAGLPTIRAFEVEEKWRERFYKVCDDWSIRRVLFMEGPALINFYIQMVNVLFFVGVVILGWYFMEPASLGVSITAAVSFSYLGSFLVQQTVELETRMTSYQRIEFYSTKLPQERDNNREGEKRTPSEEAKIPRNWPTEGTVTFDHVTFRHRAGLPYVLQDVSFSVRSGEKIGVCGRTGAGKSSLLFALFRLVELDPELQPTMLDMVTGKPVEASREEEPNKGRVVVDGMDISQVPLHRLRQSMAVIPQDPTLFTGTLRFNLDMGGQRSDDELWEVLEAIEMKAAVEEMQGQLGAMIAEGGSNLSCGQRQLICVGRAMLSGCRIVVMDEATANVDVETDAKIQHAMGKMFADQTIIVIAHRLNTIMHCDRIVVLDSGRVAEIDTPQNLMANPQSAFNGLVRSLNG
ncbi:putative Multidrug Resistance Associated Protein (MRP) [Monocercomonoides exilis]|uniref:putative Multidrug Resistance Associated Protein (MRP) n=1 Tax=Monocercomonoides exilis TaxID=2049356 RepID=UPI0035598127|nr:putative Multidrug Resistance Associated Protein (MRP) [Monocercomonoides exilis]|eukprot:MONOS_1630.1-p1 / transcript=MONOS_1630.1 / gene=MONOS_1630 / organism=Monocercomonoides_exilis_PA203 / gene_product=Multidrug Resistance Associated Protein (MRP) / transcript_product=Multidrug Resistance Associated Protein (MRP) / location=Mono_scaffold00029:200707-205468(+) / protein_length=1547 / sequence_SO=supercontig / SO=protein_coding / is_pseudo=false